MKEIRITKNEENQRLDKFLLKYMNKATKGFLYKMLRKKRIKLNGGRAEGNEMLHAGDILQLYLAEETIQSFMEEKTVAQAKRHFGIVYEDDDIVVMDYKTDRASEEELILRYKAQLDYYSDILERLTGKRVKEKIIYSFYNDNEIQL